MDEIQEKVKKASRFLDNFIKAITILSFLLFLISFYIYRFRAGDIYKNQVALCDTVWSQGLTQENPLTNPIHSYFLGYKNNCFNNAGRTSEVWGKVAFIAFDITFLLPLVYFGSKKVVKDSSEKIIRINSMT